MNKIIGFGSAMVLLLVGVGYYALQSTKIPTAKIEVAPPELPPLSPEVEIVLADKMTTALSLTDNRLIRDAISNANIVNAKLSKDEIAKLDADWRSSKGSGPIVDGYLNNGGAIELKSFQKMHPEFKEIFVTDKFGLNVSQTNKTSDYLQSDEEWWQSTWKDGIGNAHHGNIEFDESSQTEAIAIYIPMRDIDGKIIGVLKAILDLSTIKTSI